MNTDNLSIEKKDPSITKEFVSKIDTEFQEFSNLDWIIEQCKKNYFKHTVLVNSVNDLAGYIREDS